MSVRSLLSVAAIVSAVAFPGISLAQEEHMIGGKAVPADQLAEVQAKCDELRKTTSTTASSTTATPDTTEADATSTADTASLEGWLEDGTKIDLAKLTVELCDEGKFTASAM